jgi:hypothetical protein
MSTATVTAIPAQARSTRNASSRQGRRSRQQSEEGARYFLAKDGSSNSKPELGEETASEGEALIKAFQSPSSVVYILHTYRAEAEVRGGCPTLVKRPLPK